MPLGPKLPSLVMLLFNRPVDIYCKSSIDYQSLFNNSLNNHVPYPRQHNVNVDIDTHKTFHFCLGDDPVTVKHDDGKP